MRLAAAVLGIALAMVGGAVSAQSAWPNKPITMIVPYPPGGMADQLGRALAARISEELGHSIIVKNRAGAAGTVGSAELAAAEPDGHTIGIGNIGTHVTATVFDRVKYDPLTSFAHLGTAIDTYSFVGIRKNLNVKDMKDFVKWAKKNPQEVTFGTVGNGSFGHFTVELVKLRLGIPGLHIPYKGTSLAAFDLMSGRIDFMIDTLTLPAFEGKINLLATVAPQRFDGAPGIPTLREMGFDVGITGWQGVFAPAGIPNDIRDKLANALKIAVESPTFKEMVLPWGAQANYQDPAIMRERIRHEIDLFREVRRVANIAAD